MPRPNLRQVGDYRCPCVMLTFRTTSQLVFTGPGNKRVRETLLPILDPSKQQRLASDRPVQSWGGQIGAGTTSNLRRASQQEGPELQYATLAQSLAGGPVLKSLMVSQRCMYVTSMILQHCLYNTIAMGCVTPLHLTSVPLCCSLLVSKHPCLWIHYLRVWSRPTLACQMQGRLLPAEFTTKCFCWKTLQQLLPPSRNTKSITSGSLVSCSAARSDLPWAPDTSMSSCLDMRLLQI